MYIKFNVELLKKLRNGFIVMITKAEVLIKVVEAASKSRQVAFKPGKYAGIKGKDWLFISTKYHDDFPPDAKKVLEKIKMAKKGSAEFTQDELLIWKREADELLKGKLDKKLQKLSFEHRSSFINLRDLFDKNGIKYNIDKDFSFFLPSMNREALQEKLPTWRVEMLGSKHANLKWPKKERGFGEKPYGRRAYTHYKQTGKPLDAPLASIEVKSNGLEVVPKGLIKLSEKEKAMRERVKGFY